jgi:benzodiazapine receptor
MLHSGQPEGCVFNNQGQFRARYSRRHEILALVGFLLLCLGAALAGGGMAGFAGRHGGQALKLAPLGVFLPAGVVVALLAGVAAWAIWRAPDAFGRNLRALHLWFWQLGLNFLWTLVFFRLGVVLPGLVLGLVLGVLVLRTTRRFGQLNVVAAVLMLPWCGWVGFELYLNAGFWWLNR